VTRTAPDGSAAWPHARKRLGQHFLTDPRILSRIVDALAPTPSDTVVEIGPGRGALTAHLLARAGRVVAIEVDHVLAERLQRAYAEDPRLTVLARDVLETRLDQAAGAPGFLLAGNVPYYVTTPILFQALRAPRPRRTVFLVQREVADRIVAAPGSDGYGALSVNVQALAVPTLAFTVPPGAFIPPPAVESALVQFVPRTDPAVSDDEQSDYAAFVIAAFGLRRKQMRRVLRTLRQLSAGEADVALASAGVAPDVRPEVLTPEQFAALWRGLRPA